MLMNSEQTNNYKFSQEYSMVSREPVNNRKETRVNLKCSGDDARSDYIDANFIGGMCIFCTIIILV